MTIYCQGYIMTAKTEKDVRDAEVRLSGVQEELKQVSEALRQSETLFQSLIKNIPGVVYLCNCDSARTMHYIIKEIENAAGYPASDFINNNVRSFTSIIHPDDRARVAGAIEKAVAANKPYELEYRIMRRDGKIIWVQEKGRKVHSENHTVWLNGIIFDITRLKNTEEQLKQKNEQLRSIFHTAPIGIGVVSDKAFVEVNEQMCKITGYGQKELLGKSPSLLHDDIKEFERVLVIALSARENEIAEAGTRIIRKDGRKIDVLLHFSSLNPEMKSFTFTMTDVSKNK